MKKSYLFMILMLFVLGSVSSAAALTVTVGDNVANNMLISQGQVVSGQFNINPPVLPSNGNYNQPYSISSATARFRFVDDGDNAFSNTQTFTTTTNWSTCEGTRYYVQNTYNYFVDAYERVQLNVGTQVSTNGTDWYSMQLSNYTSNSSDVSSHQHSYSYSCGWHGTSTCWETYTHYVTTYYTYNTSNSISGYRGELTVEIPFAPSNIEDLSMDGQIQFTVTGADGDIIFRDGELTANVNPNPRNNNAVPEPASLLLLGLGLAGAAAVIRKRKK